MIDRNNVNYKAIRLALELDEREVIAICAHGGLTVARDRVARWARSPDAPPSRYAVMSDAEFDAFCSGLPSWWRAQDVAS